MNVLKKKTVLQKIVFVLVFIVFCLYAGTMLYAFFWGVMAGLKSNTEFVLRPFTLPEQWLFVNYAEAFTSLEVENTNLIGMIWNSLWFTVGGSLLSVFSSATIAYAVCKYRFPGNKLIYAVSIVIMTLPIVGSLPASYRLIKGLALDNSPLILITMCGGFGFNFLVLYGFYRNLSWSYAEAAFVDGAGDGRTFFSVMLPQAFPAVFSLFILAFIGNWNDYQTPLLYLDKMPTIAVGLQLFSLKMTYRSNYPVLFAATMMSIIPILVLFICFQDIIMNNTVAGGLKG